MAAQNSARDGCRVGSRAVRRELVAPATVAPEKTALPVGTLWGATSQPGVPG